MSGGYFNYDQYRIKTIAETIRSIIDNNTRENEWGDARNYNEETLKHFERAIEILKIAEVYTQRIDWLVSDDDGEETFINRLSEELAEIKAIPMELRVSPMLAGWISVKDKLPHPETMGQKLLIKYKGEIHIGKIAPNGWNLFCSDGECYYHIPIMDKVTHWMPLPKQ